MKKIQLIIALGILMTACFKQEIVPVLVYDGQPANMTIAEFQKLHTLDATHFATLIEEDAIITGIVTSTDKYNSCYKEIYFQDATGGLCIRTSNTSYFNQYPIGQRIFVKAKGLYLENYVSGSRYGFYQIGLFGGDGGTQYLSAQVENQHVFRSGIPEPCPAPKEIKDTADIALKDYHTLVTLKNCYFTDAVNGVSTYFEKLSASTTVSRRIQFNTGKGFVEARISEFCDFAKDTLPQGALNITGILTMFGTIDQSTPPPTPQLIICSVGDVVKSPPIIPAKILKSFDMKTDPFTQGWSNKKNIGEMNWTYFQGSHVQIEAPTGNESECWFVSPKFNFAGEKDVALFFTYRINTGTKDNMKALYTIDGNDWKEFDFTPQTGGNKEAMFKIPDNYASNPNLQVAFKYKTSTVFPRWAIFDITFKANVL
jgi:hypothetical protein